MKAVLIDDVITALTPGEVMRALRVAFEQVVGITPSRSTLALLTAQSALETGRWKKIHCYNLGNIKAAKLYEGFYCMFRCNEVIDKKEQWFDPPHPQTRFRGFRTLEEGARDHLEFLAQRPRYARAWQALVRGEPEVFVVELKKAGYFTADEGRYKRAVVSLCREFGAEIDRTPSIMSDQPDPDAFSPLLLPPPLPEEPLAEQFFVGDSIARAARREMSGADDDDDPVA